MGTGLDEIIFGFLQAAFTGSSDFDAEPDFDALRERLSEFGTLRVQSVLQWPKSERSALGALLRSWLIVIGLSEIDGQPYEVPGSWLQGTSSTRLNEKIVAEILHRFDALVSLHQRSRSKH